MSLLEEFMRCTKRFPCVICGHADWCLTERANPEDPARALCQRTESDRRWGKAGYLHVRRGSGRRSYSRTRTRTLRSGSNELLASEQERLLGEIDELGRNELAQQLGVSAESLRRLGLGQMSPDHAAQWGFTFHRGAWTFPMKLATGEVVGIRIRLNSGKKLAINGSRNALFIPSELSSPITQLLIAEGESDTAALLDLGYAAIGRPGCTNGVDMIVKYVRRNGVQDVVIVADRDEEGLQGAVALATSVRAYIRTVRIIQPPQGIKDARAWRKAGATRADVDAQIQSPKVWGRGGATEVRS